jgi:protease-4
MFGKSKPTAALPGSNSAPAMSNDILMRLAEDYMKDRKWRRLFKWAVFALLLIYVIGVFSMAGEGQAINAGKPHTALIELSGPIGVEGGVLSDQMNNSLRRAFENKYSKGVVMRINSPGGTPVQSAEINEEITRLRGIYPNKPMHVVVSDLCASGGYFVAVAAENIYANRSSIVGSIGVRMDSFGFVDAMRKYGIERRSITAGKNKAILDPFLPMQPAQRAHAEKMLSVVHQEFINTVKAGRGDRLSDDPDLFTGLFWSGVGAKELGLIDDFGGLDYVAREVIGQESIVDYTFRPNFLEQFSRGLGVAVGTGIGKVFSGQVKLQ